MSGDLNDDREALDFAESAVRHALAALHAEVQSVQPTKRRWRQMRANVLSQVRSEPRPAAYGGQPPTEHDLRNELRRAIQRDELVLHYQPKADFETGRIGDVEALVRWRHPRYGLMLPGRFLAVAERTGSIAPLDRWVLNAALPQCLAWRKAGLEIGVSVNLAAHNLRSRQLPELIAALLAASGMAPMQLVVEFTERAIIADPGRATENLLRLRSMGVRLSLDDFAATASSPSYLRRLPVDEIKIDRSLVLAMVSDGDDAAIVRSSIRLGHELGLSVVAEGVEDAETWERLAGLGCDLGQGNYLSRPIPAPALTRWLSDHRS